MYWRPRKELNFRYQIENLMSLPLDDGAVLENGGNRTHQRLREAYTTIESRIERPDCPLRFQVY